MCCSASEFSELDLGLQSVWGTLGPWALPMNLGCALQGRACSFHPMGRRAVVEGNVVDSLCPEGCSRGF